MMLETSALEFGFSVDIANEFFAGSEIDVGHFEIGGVYGFPLYRVRSRNTYRKSTEIAQLHTLSFGQMEEAVPNF